MAGRGALLTRVVTTLGREDVDSVVATAYVLDDLAPLGALDDLDDRRAIGTRPPSRSSNGATRSRSRKSAVSSPGCALLYPADGDFARAVNAAAANLRGRAGV